MQSLKVSVLCLILIFPAVVFAEGESLQNVAAAKSTAQNFAAGDFPNIFRPIGSFFKRLFGKRKIIYCPPPITNSVTLNKTRITANLAPNNEAQNSNHNNGQIVEVEVSANDPDGDNLIYEYQVSAGKIIGKGSSVIWDLSGVLPGRYTITVGVNDGCEICATAQRTAEIEVVDCDGCSLPPDSPLSSCPVVRITANAPRIKPSEIVVFTANVENSGETKSVYNWAISDGEIIEGQGTPTIKVKAPNNPGGIFTATVELGAVDSTCENSPSYTVEILK